MHSGSHNAELYVGGQRYDQNRSVPIPSVAAHTGERLQLCAEKTVSMWTGSLWKRLFDCTAVLLASPVALPILIGTAFLVRVTSRGPVFFIQTRIGMHGKPFSIFKFRSLEHVAAKKRNAVTTSENQRFTPIGRFLRRYKLDELPQLINVLLGDMSLVGPRPKMPEHVKVSLPCRPGVTGLATLTFAREELAFSRIPSAHLERFYHDVALPTKRALDRRYMASATLRDDLKLLFRTVLRNWDTVCLDRLVDEYMEYLTQERVPNRPALSIAIASAKRPHSVRLASISEENATSY